MNAIELTGLYKTYGSVRALDGLDLEVPTRSVFGFLGPNGAGKTTTMRLLTGLARADKGTLLINGRPVVMGQSNREVGFLPEEPAFYPWMSAAEYLAFCAEIFGFSAKERKMRSEEMLERTGLLAESKRPVGGFSRGMRQRLGIAQAMLHSPSVLLLDEPVSALDPMGRKEVLEMIDGLKEDCTILMSTHILEDVERICDTVAILRKGKRVVQSNREELMEHYASRALEIEFGNGSVESIAAIAAELQNLKEVVSVQRNGHQLRLTVNDVSEAQKAVMRRALENDWHIEKLAVVKSTLEEVFVKLVEEEGSAQ